MLVGAAALSAEGEADAPEGEPLEVSHLSDTMLTLCAVMESLLMLLLLPMELELGLEVLLACEPLS